MTISSSSSQLESDRLDLALRASNEGIWDWLTDESKIYYSRRILEFFECGANSAPNLFLAPHQAIHNLDRPLFEKAINQALDANGPETLAVDARVQTGGNSWRWLRIRGSVVRNREGHAIRIAGSMIDISLRKSAEAQIEEERHILRNLIDHVPMQIYFKDVNSKLVLGNQKMAEYHGFDSAEKLVGRHDKDLFLDDHWKKAATDEQKIMSTGEAMTGILERETWQKGGETFVMTSKFPWKGKDGSLKGTFGISSDVTSLVLAQRQATELANELQQKNEIYEEELKLAREIQQALSSTHFPEKASGNGLKLNFSSRYLPSSGLAGDFFEVLSLGEDRYGVFICDVMGHGVRAALVVSMLRGLIATLTQESREASKFLTALNVGLSSILQRANVTMFATAFYGVIDLKQNFLEYSCAGHPGPMLTDGQHGQQLCSERKAKGPALGLIENAKFITHRITLESVKRILLFTDGVLEAENENGEQFLERRLQEVAASCEEKLDDWLNGIIESVLDFSVNHHFEDDVCLLGIEILPESLT